MNTDVYLLLGSNQGRPREHLRTAVAEIGKRAGSVVAQSSLYRSAAWGMEQQPDFLNQVVSIATAHPPEALLTILLGIEEDMGRLRREKWGPRIIDIDLLLYGDEIRNTAPLMLPHPGIPQRRFTLMPLAEIAGGFMHPVFRKNISTLLAECPDPLRVTREL